MKKRKERSGSSLKDIAAEAGVSAATVSRVLNNKNKGFSVRPAVRERILQVAQDLNYQPDLIARSLRGATMRIFGLVGLEPPYNFPHRMISGILEELEPRGIQLSAHFVPSQGGALESPAWKVDGIFVIAAHRRSDIDPIDSGPIPYVSINAWHGPRGLAVMMNDVQGTRLAMTHLLELGHRKIAFASTSGSWQDHPSVDERLGTYRSVLRDAGLSPLDDLPTPDAINADEFLHEARRCGATAVLAYNHFIGMSVLKSAIATGLSVPDDLSLVCFNDEYEIDLVQPPLTRVALPVVEAGRLAAQRLIARVEGTDIGGNPPRLDEKLIIRDSTTVPKIHL